MDTHRIAQAGQRTRFGPGNKFAVGHGRPRTGRIRAKFRRLLSRWGEHSFASNFAQIGETVLAEALKGKPAEKKDARELLHRVLGAELAKEWLDTAKQAIETGRLRIYRYPQKPREKVTVRRQSVEKLDGSLKNTPSASIEGNSQEFQPIPRAFVHETARALMGVAEDRPTPAKRAVKVELW